MRYLSEDSLKRLVGGLPTINARIDLDKFLACLKNVKDIEIGRCKDCAHYPINADKKPESGFDIEWPEDTDGWEDCACLCHCSDPYYSWVPPADGFCHLWAAKEK